jgi:hypothetical protein
MPIHVCIKMELTSVKRNNGILKVLFQYPGNLSEKGSQPEAVLANLSLAHGEGQEGQSYWITIEPAFPTEV